MLNSPLGGVDADGHSICVWCMHFTEHLVAVAKDVGLGLVKTAVNTINMFGGDCGNCQSRLAPTYGPSNLTQAVTMMAAPFVVPGVSVAVSATAAAPVELEAAPSIIDTYFHYGQMADEAKFSGGLRPGSFATTDGTLTGAEAKSTLALPQPTPPNAVYTVTPEPGTPVNGPTTVQPQFGQPGGGQEVTFPQGTGPGTVSPPKPIPPS
jgi:hypothetical protein